MCLLEGIRWGVSVGFYGHPSENIRPGSSHLNVRLDSIRNKLKSKQPWTLRPLDPNDLEDYRGYLLGIPFEALDSLYAFRSGGGVVRKMDQFQSVTGLSDSSCYRLEPFFRFPETKTQNRKIQVSYGQDLNSATAIQLRTVHGIGPVLSKRIVRFREALGGFITSEQLLDVYGLSPELAKQVGDLFPLRTIPPVKKVNVNRASVEELSGILYLSREMARDLVAYRSNVGAFRNLAELHQVESLPKDKIGRIALYLTL
jgi:DNA uptake protein ComE-like DNA-binding protein